MLLPTRTWKSSQGEETYEEREQLEEQDEEAESGQK